MSAQVYIGPAGWQYKDWQGIAYPQPKPKGFKELRYLSDFVNVVEVNSSFYKIPSPNSVQEWLGLVRYKSNFKFSIKLFQGFTHRHFDYTRDEVLAFSKSIEALQRDNRLAALLIQFPWKFKNTPEALERVLKISRDFSMFPCAVEFRHASWMTDDIYKQFQDSHISFVNIDEPAHNQSLPQSDIVTSPIGYIRFHGRNSENWFKDNVGQDQRYNYLYNDSEMYSWLDSIKRIRDRTEMLIIIFNNHFKGQALVNGIQLGAVLEEKKPVAPVTLLRHYPQLQSITDTKDDEQLFLFD